MKTADIAKHLRQFESQYIPFPTFVAAKNAIEGNLLLYRQSGLARHMLVLGSSGTGKSSLCKWMASNYPKQVLLERDYIPVLHVVIPPTATVLGVADAILKGLGDPHSRTGSIANKTARIITLCRACGVELILFDEAQHLQDRGDSRTHYMVGDWLKHLIDEIGVPIVLVGLPRLQSLLQTNEQLRRRFSRKVWLSLGRSDEDSIETECLQLFLSLSHLLTIPVSSQSYDSAEMGQRLYYACDGRVAYIKKLLFGAMLRALDQNLKVIDAEILQRAFRDEIWSEAIGKLNPFDPAFDFRKLDRRDEPFGDSAARATRQRG